MFCTGILLGLENSLRLAQPLVIGLAINDLLAASYRGLMLFAAQHLSYLLVGAVRQMYQARVSAELEAAVAGETQHHPLSTGVVSAGPAEQSLLEACSEFYEAVLPRLVQALFSVWGALLALCWYDVALVPLCLLLTIPAGLLNAAFGRQTLLLLRRLHGEEAAGTSSMPEGAYRGAGRRSRECSSHWRIKLSDSEAIRLALMELFVLGLLATTLVHYCTSGSSLGGGPVQPGDVFAVFRYVTLFVMGLDALPDMGRRLLSDNVSAVRQLTRRRAGSLD